MLVFLMFEIRFHFSLFFFFECISTLALTNKTNQWFLLYDRDILDETTCSQMLFSKSVLIYLFKHLYSLFV